jgi:cytochrome oxidase Cu insertion factor (SCO1/SenC/PrrC family)
MFLVLLICAAPVVASYVTYYFIRPDARTNYSDLIDPVRPMPEHLPLLNLQGQSVSLASLKGQWLIVVVSAGACDSVCEKNLDLQRRLREVLGREKDRVDKVWLIADGRPPRAPVYAATTQDAQPTTVLHAPKTALLQWLLPEPGHSLADHLYVVDPRGHWMMRMPVNPDPAKLKRDMEKLLRASASWDKAGR